MAELRHINAFLTADQVQRVADFMSENNIRHFSDGLREYLRHIEAKLSPPRGREAVAA